MIKLQILILVSLSMKILITGIAGFIGFNLAKFIASEENLIIGIDNINDYYDVNLKLSRLMELGINSKKGSIDYSHNKPIPSSKYNLKFYKADLQNLEHIDNIFKMEKIDIVVNLAAQAGVRHSLKDPFSYIQSNIVGFINLLESSKKYSIKNFVYASSSSVYGLNTNMPFSTHNGANHPISLYAATKKSNEMMAHAYSHLFNIPTTGLRFFTVYGPWGRPDMALFLFVKAALNNQTIDIFNNGKMKRDFTYIDDIVKGISNCIDNPAKPNLKWDSNNPDPATSTAPFKIYNIGNNNSVNLMDYIKEIEKKLNIEIKKNFLPMQPGDVAQTIANVDDLINDFDYKPNTSIKDGISKFVDWYKDYYKF